MNILITRPLIDSEDLMGKLFSLGHKIVHIPTLKILAANAGPIDEKKYDAFIALGCVIKGETPHFDFISKSSIDAIMKLSIENKKPVGNGILTCLNKEQAVERADKSHKNKGKEAADAAIELLIGDN